jgi:hypothetical protein
MEPRTGRLLRIEKPACTISFKSAFAATLVSVIARRPHK